MKKFYILYGTLANKYADPIDFNITDDRIVITSGDVQLDLSFNDLKNREDKTPFCRFYVVTKPIVDALTGDCLLKLTNNIINLYPLTRTTKQTCDEYCKQHNLNLPFSINLQPHAVDFSEVDISIHATPADIITASGVEPEVIVPNTNRNKYPKFQFEGLSTISPDTKQTYKISYINRGTGQVDNSANYRVVINSNIGVLNKRDTNLINGSTIVTLDATGLTSGEKISLEVGMYEYTNTSQLNIDVL